MFAASARATATCVAEPDKYADFDPVDVLEVPWLANHQRRLSRIGDYKMLSHSNVEKYDKVILVVETPAEICQPYLLVHRYDLNSLIPSLAEFLDSRDVDIPPIGNLDRCRSYEVNPECTHFMSGVIKEVKLFAVIDTGKNLEHYKSYMNAYT